MKKLIWLALLLPFTAQANWGNDLCDDIGWSHPLCANIQALATISAAQDEALEAEIGVVRSNHAADQDANEELLVNHTNQLNGQGQGQEDLQQIVGRLCKAHGGYFDAHDYSACVGETEPESTCYYGTLIPGGYLLIDGVVSNWHIFGWQNATTGPSWDGVENTYDYRIYSGGTETSVYIGRESKQITAYSPGIVEGNIEGTCLLAAAVPE